MARFFDEFRYPKIVFFYRNFLSQVFFEIFSEVFFEKTGDTFFVKAWEVYPGYDIRLFNSLFQDVQVKDGSNDSSCHVQYGKEVTCGNVRAKIYEILFTLNSQKHPREKSTDGCLPSAHVRIYSNIIPYPVQILC